MIRVIIFAVIIIGVFIKAFRMAHVPFYDWDEAIYAQIANEMLHNHTLLTTYNSVPWLEKPPLGPGILALFFVLLGHTELSLRLGMAFLSSCLILLQYLLTQRVLKDLYGKQIDTLAWWQKEIVYMLPTIAFAATTQFIDRSTNVNVDILLAIGWVGFFAFRTNFYLKWLFIAIGVGSKSFLGFYPLFFEVFQLRKKSFSIRNVVLTSALFALMNSWYLYGLIHFKKEFISIHIMDHLVKRVTKPIELHSGGKFYYLESLWTNYEFMTLLIVLGYFVLSVLFISKFLHRKSMRSFLSQINPAYYILLSPAIFFAFLTIGKTKLFWYLYPLLPILAILISVTYVYVAKIRKPIIVSFIAQFLLVCIVLEAFIRSFIPHSYGYRASISLPEKVRVAWCISQLPGKDVAYMVNNDERDIAHLLEAAQLQIHSSFVYGGTPVTLYYSGKRIDYFYKKEEFVKVADTYPIFVISRYDLAHDVPIVVLSQSLAYKQVCSSKDWVVYSVL